MPFFNSLFEFVVFMKALPVTGVAPSDIVCANFKSYSAITFKSQGLILFLYMFLDIFPFSSLNFSMYIYI